MRGGEWLAERAWMKHLNTHTCRECQGKGTEKLCSGAHLLVRANKGASGRKMDCPDCGRRLSATTQAIWRGRKWFNRVPLHSPATPAGE